MIVYVILIAAAICPGLVIIVFWLVFRTKKERKVALENATLLAGHIHSLETKYKPILDMEAEVQRLVGDAQFQENRIANLRSDYSDKKSIYDRLLKEVAVFDDKLAFAEMGVYDPHFDFTDSEKYKSAILTIREQQKAMISAENAVICTTKWSVDGSAAKGQTMTRRNVRLTLRAFNNECDAAIANTRWNNVNAMEKRILNAQAQIDKHNASNSVFVTGEFVRLKLKELYLTHEHREKLKAEKEERAETARLAREEQRLIRDMEQAQEEEDHYQRLLDKAKAEAASIVGPKLDAFADQIKQLERDLAAAHAKVERAQAMAEKTRSGYVYIISNIGSFGGDIVKIGLTRRLDPLDRVRELGDASVPFVFDTHAIIYSDDAPTLERALHGEFEPTRVNAQNYRKEFFRASLDDVEAAVKRLAPNAPFFKDIEAQEYHETLSRRRQVLELIENAEQALFPDAI
ncbi:MAG: DUF4041 domain-containing protein [Mesorhizobium sp.]|uniref:DUF4041 domain-containing protein n=1 Tax=Mesorhizobium sp. TaxID=1871066 RepID=UPI000FE849CE|nr:DUF4041 domain-containing protein [Mesorhizobium sp.]RWM10255.1 MAG: DUF4041 domain-containing protein [Mesorhizobium sp.]TIP69250.1 MAG: DUF4041 domain-containing protein [Mesorhizobium sp.]TIQ02879.1 MAG: DUF4041 domain-containing protein [Mesorhizobium sp.]TIR47414.1 MAG: DUF4041 domain-containing protein [Mesorhizobium sp.]TJV92088.1 MAG: DUF4041 domain-containing protein [Mesorhizobium sp.]